MKKSNLVRNILMLGLLFIFFSCDKDEFINDNSENSISTSDKTKENSKEVVIYGPKIEIGKGYAFSWIRVDNNVTPIEIGIEMTPSVLVNLPKDSDFTKAVVIPLPKKAIEITPFNHIGINWVPENFSDIENLRKAHFSFHFYTITLAERMKIPAWSDETEEEFSNYPQKNYMPADYFPLTNGIGSYAMTGRHWLPQDPKNTFPSSHIFALGTYDGKFVFMDPIATLDLLNSGEEINNFISQPLYYPINKPFPREYTIFVNNNKNRCVTLHNFIHR